jgi:hypothetical protein
LPASTFDEKDPFPAFSGRVARLAAPAGGRLRPAGGPKQPADYVNPLIGTAPSTTESARRHSEAGSELKGQTFPATGVPHGLTQWTPQTHATEQKCLSPYYYQETKIQGFRGSRWMSGSCTQDYGSVTLMPMTGKLVTDVAARASAYSHDREKALPYAYSVPSTTTASGPNSPAPPGRASWPLPTRGRPAVPGHRTQQR